MNISNISKNNAKINEYKKEWQTAFYAVWGFRALTSILSILTGFYSLYLLLCTVIPISLISVPVAIITLVFVELLSSELMTKFAKFALRGKTFFRNSIILLPLVFLAVGASFYFSTNGLAAFVSDKVDESAEITTSYNIESDALNTQFSADLTQINNQIQYIQDHPAWKGKLTRPQLDEIKALNAERVKVRQTYSDATTSLKSLKNDKLEHNTKTQTSKASDFYIYAVVLIALQFVLSFLIANMSRVIYMNDNAKQYINETTTAINNSVLKNMQQNAIIQSNNFAKTLREQYNLNTILTDYDELSSNLLGVDVEVLKRPENDIKTDVIEKKVEKEPDTTTTYLAADITADTAIKKDFIKAVKQHTKNAENDTKSDVVEHETKKLTDNTRKEETKPKGYGMAICKHCETEFFKNVWNKKFCCESCKLAYWEQTTGKKAVFRATPNK